MTFDPIKCFRLSTIRLDRATFSTNDDIEALQITDDSSVVETRRWVTHAFDMTKSNEERLKAIVNCGLRLTKPLGLQAELPEIAANSGAVGELEHAEDGEPPSPLVYYTIEAAFAVDFVVVCKDYTDQDLAHFVAANAAHVAWPFWREHVFSTLRAASLPPAEVPLMPPVKKVAMGADGASISSTSKPLDV